MAEKIKPEDFFKASDHKLAVRDIFAMYHHKWDCLGESIQNAVDSVLKRSEEGAGGYKPQIWIVYDSRTQELSVKDNGTGIKAKDLRGIVAPHVSHKNPLAANRGEFGVGLTFVAFSSNQFCISSTVSGESAELKIRNGYSWAMDNEEKQDLDISFTADTNTSGETCTVISFKPVRFPEYSIAELKYILRRHTAIGDFWACFKNEKTSRIKATLSYIDEMGKKADEEVPAIFWHPADHLSEIDVECVDFKTVKAEVDKGKDSAMPNWIGFGLIDKDTITEKGKEFTYYALFCRVPYYMQIARRMGLASEVQEDDDAKDETPETEVIAAGIFTSKKGMPLGAVVERPRSGEAGYWRGVFIVMHCDAIRTEPGRKKLHADDEQIAKAVAKKIFSKLTNYSHYIFPRDPDAEMDSLLRSVDKNIDAAKECKANRPLPSLPTKVAFACEPSNEQTLIALFHELIGSQVLLGYRALKLSSVETYDGIYDYDISKSEVGKEAWDEWVRTFPAKERVEIETKARYQNLLMIVEFKLNLESVIKDFLQKSKYHHHIKLIVAWDADDDIIKKRGWLLEQLPKSKRRFFGTRWRLRPSAEGQTRGILATDVLLLKRFLQEIKG